VRSYAIATVAGRKRVTAVVNPAWPSDPDNAAHAHYAAGFAKDYKQAFHTAREALSSGKTGEKLRQLKKIQGKS